MSIELKFEKVEVMCEEEKIKKAKQYFISKLFTYFEKENLISKRSESFRYLMLEIVEVHKEIKLAKNELEVNRLTKAMKYLFEELRFVIDYNPIFRNPNLEKDFTQFKKIIDPCIKSKVNDGDFALNVNKVINSLTSLNKKVKISEVIDSHFSIILNQKKPMQFNDVDIVVDSLVNESLFMHSPKHIKEWIEHYSKTNTRTELIDDEFIKQLQLKFISENFKSKKRLYIVRVQMPESISNKIDLKNEPMLLEPMEIMELSNEIKNFNKIENHLFPKKGSKYFIKQELDAADKYQASSILSENINRFLEVYKLIIDTKGLDASNKGLYRDEEMSKWEFIDILNLSDDLNKSLLNKLSKREEEDIKEFIKIRNKKLSTHNYINDLFLLERAYSLINKSKELTLENQLLNTWLAMEHMVTPYISDAIIEKIRQVIPKVVSMYYVKERMNVLWEEINNFNRINNSVELDSFIKECQQNGSWKYDKKTFGVNLKDSDKVEKLIELMANDINIVRILMELNGLLNNFQSVQKRVEEIKNLIVNDLNRIYRVRNKIVHSGINLPDNLNLITLRLNNYVIGLLSTIIHYMKQSDEVTVEDVLNSIVETYSWFIDKKTKGLKIEEIITPRYLYL